jgi:hypothetical protein
VNVARLQADKPRGQFQVHGRITDKNGQPMEGVEVRSHIGMGTLFQGDGAISNKDGNYELFFDANFGSQPSAIISAHRDEYFEQNLNRQGHLVALREKPSDEVLDHWDVHAPRLILPHKPIQLDFVMQPAGRLAGTLVDEYGKPAVGYSVSLAGSQMPPGCSVIAHTKTERDGRFGLGNIPTTFRYQLVIHSRKPTTPGLDSWASAGLRFDQSNTEDVHAWFGNREIRVQDFVVRVDGEGTHQRTSCAIAGKRGQLNLKANDSAEILERSDQRLILSAATLTLCNDVAEQLSNSLISDKSPVFPAYRSK